MLFRRAAYERIGGHAAIRDHIVEDVALGREVARRIPEGMRLVNCDASRLIDCRMYRSFTEVTATALPRTSGPPSSGSLATWYLVGGLQFTAFFLPFVLIFFPSQFRLALVEMALIYLIRVILTIRMRTSWVGCILHPIGQFLAMAIAHPQLDHHRRLRRPMERPHLPPLADVHLNVNLNLNMNLSRSQTAVFARRREVQVQFKCIQVPPPHSPVLLFPPYRQHSSQ